MKILLLSQVFYPDVVAVAQYVADLATNLGEAGHDVTVLCSSHGYDAPARRFPRRQTWKGIRIQRVPVLALGKKSKLRRIVSFASFFISCFYFLLIMPAQDVVVVVPPPPLLSVVAALFVLLRGGRLVFWNMDLNPDEAIAAGWLRHNSLTARLLGAALRFSLDVSSSVVVLDRFMKERVVAKGIPSHKVHIVPVWSLDHAIHFDAEGRDLFRRRLGVENKFVVMYSGNHSPLHPLDTVLNAALQLRDDPTVAFAFVGGGSEFSRVERFAREYNLSNIVCEPYQSLDRLAGSLSAADLQVVVLGKGFVGIVHPCKIYNMLAVGAPFLYIGPAESHITDLRQDAQIAAMGKFVRHGDSDQVVQIIKQLASDSEDKTYERPGRPAVLDRFSQTTLVPSLIGVIEMAGKDQ